GGDRKVDDADLERVAVRDHPFERRNHIADVTLAGGVEHFERDQASAGRDAGARAGRVVPIAGDDAGHVRAVSVIVVRRLPAADEIDERVDALSAARAGEIVVPGGDARIDHRDADARTVVPELPTNGRCADRSARALHPRADRAIEDDATDARI